jgi:cell division protein FtsB
VRAGRLGTTVVAVAALAVLGVGGQSLARAWRTMQDVESLERDITVLRAETAALSATVARLRTDPETIERAARERLGLIKPGERVLKLPPSPGGQ